MLDRSVTSHGTTTALVGRERELDLPRGCLADILAGHGGLLPIGGVPGFGGPRVADRLADDLSGQSDRRVWGLGTDGELAGGGGRAYAANGGLTILDPAILVTAAK